MNNTTQNQHKNISRVLARKFRALDRKFDGKISFERKKREELNHRLQCITENVGLNKSHIEYLADRIDKLCTATTILSWGLVLVAVGLITATILFLTK